MTHKLIQYANKVKPISGNKQGAMHSGQFIMGNSVSEVVAKMCQLDVEKKIRNHEMQQPKY